MRPVDEALVILALVAKREPTVPTVVEELVKYAWLVVVKLVANALESVVCPVTLSVEENVPVDPTRAP